MSTILSLFAKHFYVFGSSVSLNAAGEEKVNSVIGAMLSVLTLVITLTYASQRTTLMVDFADTVH